MSTITKNLPRDVFLYLLAIVTLVAVAVAFGIVIFQIINVYIPDIVSDPYFSRSSYLSTMRSSLAVLIVVFPVFLWVSRFLKRDMAKFPEKKELKIRKWLLYLTLFVAALVIIGDLVTLLRSFLEGELSQRFILKVFTILFIAGSVFIHYLSELKEDDKKFNWVLGFDKVVIVAVVASIVGGFWLAGSPQNQRLVRLDERRVSDLQQIQWQLINYWQRKQALPGALADLNDPISNFMVPMDPETGEAYEYMRLDDLKFELCASFNTEQSGGVGKDGTLRAFPESVGPYYDTPSAWQHGTGKVCFERTIDPQLYPPVKDAGSPRPL